jgi:hypothetical protein
MGARIGRLAALVESLARSGFWSADSEMRESLARLYEGLDRARMHLDAERMRRSDALPLDWHERREGSERGERARARRIRSAFRRRRSAAKTSVA